MSNGTAYIFSAVPCCFFSILFFDFGDDEVFDQNGAGTVCVVERNGVGGS